MARGAKVQWHFRGEKGALPSNARRACVLLRETHIQDQYTGASEKAEKRHWNDWAPHNCVSD